MPPLSERDHVLGAPDAPTTWSNTATTKWEHFMSGVRSGVNGTPTVRRPPTGLVY